MLLGKRQREGEARPGKAKLSSIPANLPDPHSKSFPPRHPWEADFTRVSNQLRKKPEWTKKVFQEDILAKWKEELAANGFSFFWERLKAELQYLASLSTPEAEPSSVDGVWVADNVIPKDLHDLFVSQVRDQLEVKEKDWHPSSGETVVDLVHPSLFCFVDGRTPFITDEEI